MIEKITINKRGNDDYRITDLRDGFLICLPKKSSLDDFLIAAKVESGSYASVIISRLFHALMTSAINIQEEYSRYYSKEYETLDWFLFWKYSIPFEISNKVFKDMKDGEIVFYNTFLSGCSWTADAFINDPIMMKTLNEIVEEVRRIHYENSK